MAIKYCDFISGNDSNDGLSVSTPKKTLSAAVNLISSINDEVRVRGSELPTNIGGNGSIWWRNGSTTLTGTTDLSSVLSVNDYIYKSTDTIPEVWKVTSVNWNGSTMTIGLNVLTGYYEGTTETCDIMKITLPPSGTTASSMGKTLYYSGTNTDIKNRTLTKVSGGWNADYTEQTFYTIYYKPATLALYGNGYYYYDITKFMFLSNLGWPLAGFSYSKYSNIVVEDGVRALGFSNWNYVVNNVTHNSGNPIFEGGKENIIENNILRFGGNVLFNTNNSLLSGNTITNHNVLNYQNDQAINNFFIGNTFKPVTHFARNIFNCYFSGNTVILSNTGHYSFNLCKSIYAINNNITGGNTKLVFSNGTFINNGFTGYEDLIVNYDIFSYNYGYSLYGCYIYEPNKDTFTLPTKAFAYPNSNVMTNYIYNPSFAQFENQTVNVKLSNNQNILLYNSAAVQTTGVTQSGSTGLKVTQYNTNYVAIAGTVDFIVQTGTTYNYSFYIKSSNNQNFSYNFLYFGNYLTNWISGTTSSSTWTEITGTLPSITTNGNVKLYIKFNSGTGHYIYLSNIRLT